MQETIFIVGGTGAQGMAVIAGLVQDGKYRCRVLTRNITSENAKYLESLGNVELFKGDFTNEDNLRKGFKDCQGSFVNIDGFNTGEKAEMFWAIRIYEIAIEQKVKFFVYGNLEYASKIAKFDPKFRCGHYDGKGRIGEWILMQQKMAKEKDTMGVALLTAGPYMDMLITTSPLEPKIINEVVTWKAPFGKVEEGQGVVPFISLEDCGYYVRWLFDHRQEANGMDLQVGIDLIKYDDMAKAFTKVTGVKAEYIDIDMETYWKEGPLADFAQRSTGYSTDIKDPAAMSYKDNFTGAFNLWKYAGRPETAILKRDYALLDRIHPNRIKTAEQWFIEAEKRGKQNGTGSLVDKVKNLKPALKSYHDIAEMLQAAAAAQQKEGSL